MSKSTTGKPTTLKLDAPPPTDSTSSDTTALSSGDVVIAAATSGSGSVSKVYKHWADGDDQPAQWQGDILQDNKSNYFEGEVIPHVFVYTASNNTPLVNGQSYSFNITYNFYQQTTNAGGFAFITDYDTSRDPGLVPGLSQIEPVEDSTFTNGGGIQGSFSTVDADITSVSDVTYTGSGGNLDGYVTVTFTYTGTTTTSGFAEIYYGLFVANPGQVPDQGSGTTDGAAAWTGGSLQTTVDIGGSGATSLQLAPNAIIVGEISGIKFNDINGDGVRDADGTDNVAGNADDEAGLAGWTIFLDTNGNGTLDAGENSTVTGADGTYVFSVTPDADKTDGQLDNDPYLVREVQQAGWTQTTANPAPILITADDPTETNVNFGNQQPAPTILLAKDGTYVDVNGNGALNAGDQIQYTFVVTNTGNVALTNVSITDDSFELDDPTDPTDLSILAAPIAIGNLAAGASSAPQVVNYTLTQEDIDDLFTSGDFAVDNLATAHGFFGATEVTDDDPATVQLPAGLDATLLIDKSAVIVASANDADGIIDSATDDILYTITVTNGGDVTLNNVIVIDPRSTNVDDVVGTIPTLAPGASQTFTFEYDVLQSEIDSNGTDADGVADNDGDIDNTSAAVADEAGPVFDSAFVPLLQNPALNITKDASVPGGTADAAGELISYTITVENTGNQTLTGVTVTDPFADPGSIVRGADVVGDNDADLEVGETWGFTATHTVTQAEIDSNGGGDGFLENTATADSDQTGPDTDDAAVPVEQIPALTIDKTVTDVGGDGPAGVVDEAGDVISYEIVVDNTGNIALTGVTVTDEVEASGATVLGSPTGDTDNDGALDIDETWTYTASYTVTQADLDNNGGGDGLIHNVAIVDTDQTPPDDDDEFVPLEQNPAINIDKITVAGAQSGDGLTGVQAGSAISWEYTVTNIGNVTLANVVVTDDAGTPGNTADDFTATFTGGDSNNNGLLDLSETWTFSASGTAIVGQYNNLGTVTAFETDGDPDPVTDSDPSSYVGVGDFGLIAPTQTTCHDYINGTAQSLDLAQYSVRNGEISQTNPGVFFYYTGLSGAIVGADGPDAGTAADPLTIFIDQSDDSAVIGPFGVHKDQVLLFKISDLNDNGIIDAGDECVRVKLNASQITINDGDVTVNFTPDGVGSLYVLSVKYETNSLVGTDVTAPFPTAHYDFETFVNGTFAETDSGGLDFAPKPQSTAVAQLDSVQLIGSSDPTSADVFMT